MWTRDDKGRPLAGTPGSAQPCLLTEPPAQEQTDRQAGPCQAQILNFAQGKRPVPKVHVHFWDEVKSPGSEAYLPFRQETAPKYKLYSSEQQARKKGF